jgi:hypothetical protein
MILRRVTEHVKAQNWFAVVAGVFIGLQVANWNAARQARADERVFMQLCSANIGSETN